MGIRKIRRRTFSGSDKSASTPTLIGDRKIRLTIIDHGYSVGDKINLTGANESEYNIEYVVSNVVDTDTIVVNTGEDDVTVSSVPTGTLTATKSEEVIDSVGTVLEELFMICNGATYRGSMADYVPTDVTARQNMTTSHVRMNGSNIDYLPPVGTKAVYYSYHFQFRFIDAHTLCHFAIRLNSTQITDSRWTLRNHNSTYEQSQQYIEYLFRITGTDNNTTGTVASWDTAKTIDATSREYSSSYDGALHTTDHWDGGGTDIVVKPKIHIIAFG